MLHHVAVLLFFLRTMLRMASHSKLLAWLFHKCLCHDIMQLFFILWHWWQYGSMQCLHCSDFTSNPARPFLFGLVGCSHPGSLQGKSQNWRPCPSRAQNQQARSKVKSLWQLHSSYMKALGAFNSQLLSSGTNTANGVNRVSRPQTSEATCGGFKNEQTALEAFCGSWKDVAYLS